MGLKHEISLMMVHEVASVQQAPKHYTKSDEQKWASEYSRSCPGEAADCRDVANHAWQPIKRNVSNRSAHLKLSDFPSPQQLDVRVNHNKFLFPVAALAIFGLAVASGQTQDTSGNGLLKGSFRFRHVAVLNVDDTYDPAEIAATYGTIKFNGAGNYTVASTTVDNTVSKRCAPASERGRDVRDRLQRGRLRLQSA